MCASSIFPAVRVPRRARFYLTSTFLLLAATAFAVSLSAAQRGIKRVEIRTESGEQVGLYEESHALVIGVSDYEHWPKLPGVRRDVSAVSAALEKNGFSVQTVLDPDQDALDEAFESFIEKHGGHPENRLLFYFAGHGHTVQPRFGGEPLGYLVPTDAPVPTLGKREERRFKRVAMSMQRIEEYALNIDAKHALFLFDACFSGSLFALSRAIPESINYKTAKPVRQFITSGSADETVPDQSIFRGQFVAALQGEADSNRDGYLSGTELGQFLQDSVVNYSKGAQHPQYGKIRNPNLDKGDFVFTLPQIRLGKIESTPALPDKPSSGSFSLADLNRQAEREKSVRAEWQKHLDKMLGAFNKVRGYEQQSISPSLKSEAWRRFSQAFSENNPYSTEDEDLRSQAKKRMSHWKDEQRRLETEKQKIAEAKRKAEAERKEKQELAALRQKQESAGSWTEPLTGMKFRGIPGGSFRMGDLFREGGSDEKNIREVTLSPFWLGAYEVTQGQWKKIMGNNNNPSSFKGDSRPVENVSWHDVQEFIRKLNARSGRRFRLPTEAEWEYACREGGRKVRFCNGKNTADPAEINFNARSGDKKSYSVVGKYPNKTVPVGRFSPNSLGLYQMSGNVWEWTCSEWNDPYDERSENCMSAYRAKDNDIRRSLRGGSWNGIPWNVRSAARNSTWPGLRSYGLGFRLARD